MIAWMAYAALIGGIVAVGGVAMERLATAMGQPRRIAWLAALTLAVSIPLAGVWRKPAAAPVVVESETAQPSAIAGGTVENFWSAIPALPVPHDVPTGKIAIFAWGAGSLASLAVLAGVLVQVARGRRRWGRTNVHGADVYVSRRFGPALVGVARPKVVIPKWVLDLAPGARDAIIRHETEHARARDHLVLLYGGLVAAAFPWSPAIWWMYRRLRAAVELDCDQRVLASGIGVADYGDVLLAAGRRSRRRWSFAPAMGQPESLLERRLKTMSETGKKLSAGYAALLVAVAAGALVVACDTPVPTEVREAFEEVMAEDEAQGADAEREGWVERFLGAKAFGSATPPLLYVDGVRIRSEEDLSFATAVYLADVETGEVEEFAESIERIEVLKGAAAAKLYGEEAAGGVIQIFTKGPRSEPEVEVKASLRVSDTVLVKTGKDLIIGRTGPPPLKTLTVRAARDRRRVSLRYMGPLLADTLVVTGQASVTAGDAGWHKWLSERGRAGERSDPGPVVYIDGVRIDGGASGRNGILQALKPDDIDRVEVIKGEDAKEKYGKEGAYGVILIFTKKKPSDKPSTRRSK